MKDRSIPIAPFQEQHRARGGPAEKMTRKLINGRQYLVPVRDFDAPDQHVPQWHERADGVIVDRQLIEWHPVDRFPPPEQTALLVAIDDPDWPDEFVTEFAEFSRAMTDTPHWRFIGGDTVDLPIAYWARFPLLPRKRPEAT